MEFDRYYDYSSQARAEWNIFKSHRPRELENIGNKMKGIYWIFQYVDRAFMLWIIHSHPNLRNRIQLLSSIHVTVFQGRGEKYDISHFLIPEFTPHNKMFSLQYLITTIISPMKTRYHESALLYDHKNGNVQHFEPLGDLLWLSRLEEMIKERLPPGYRFEPSYKICPKLGPQTIIDKGYCAAFSTYFFWMKIHDLDRPLKDIITELLELPDDFIRMEIENFISFAFLIIHRHKLYLLEIYYEKIMNYLETRRDYEEQIKLIDRLYEEFNFTALEELSRKSTELLQYQQL